MKFVGVLPSIWAEWTDLCVASMDSTLWNETIVVDNVAPNPNRGVAASWNLGVDALYERDADWLVIISAATRFGSPGGLDFLAHLEDAVGTEWAIEAGECPRQRGIGFGWHLIAFPRLTFDRVGRFDENFWPAYWEDCDFGHRIRCATPAWQPGPDPLWPKVDVDADLEGFAHGVKLAGVESMPHRLAAYYARKWGGPPSAEEYVRPFGDQKLGLDWWPPIAPPG